MKLLKQFVGLFKSTSHLKARKLFAEALRSGKYKQGRFALKRSDDGETWSYCCLGVACELYNEVVKPLETDVIGSGDYRKTTFDTCTGVMPRQVSKWLQMDNIGRFDTPIGVCTLTSENDHAGKTFEQIADIIESADFRRPR